MPMTNYTATVRQTANVEQWKKRFKKRTFFAALSIHRLMESSSRFYSLPLHVSQKS